MLGVNGYLDHVVVDSQSLQERTSTPGSAVIEFTPGHLPYIIALVGSSSTPFKLALDLGSSAAYVAGNLFRSS